MDRRDGGLSRIPAGRRALAAAPECEEDGEDQLGYVPHPNLARLFPIVDGIARALGPSHEIVIHDLRHPDRSLCHIAGNVTGRAIGAPATNVLLEAVQQHGDAAPDVFNYATMAGGRPIRSSILFIRAGERIVGALAVNVDVTLLQALHVELGRMIGLDPRDQPRAEAFENTVGDLLHDLVATTISSRGATAASSEERMAVVAALQESGAFQVKGSVELVARELGVSRFTVYSYLQKLRAGRETARTPTSIDGTDRALASIDRR